MSTLFPSLVCIAPILDMQQQSIQPLADKSPYRCNERNLPHPFAQPFSPSSFLLCIDVSSPERRRFHAF